MTNEHESTATAVALDEQQQQQQQHHLTYPYLTAQQKNSRTARADAEQDDSNRSLGATTPTVDEELVQAKQAEEEQRREEYISGRDSLLRSLQTSSQLLARLQNQCLQHSWFRYPPPAVYQPRILDVELQSNNLPSASSPLYHRSSVSAVASRQTSLLQSLEPASIQNLLSRRVQFARQHLERLDRRARDSTSKVLITGDLNSGKSTLINALLRRDLLPHDQQPCTSAFCEVLDASLNGGVEEVHAIPDPVSYRLDDPSTYRRYPISFMQSMVGTDEMEKFVVWKVYCSATATTTDSDHDNILRNGVIDVTFIDSPGLNSDSTKTMAVFGQQEEIDAIVFVLNSENHFTQSAAEFLAEAKKEKPYIFIVANRFDLIGDKKRCRRQIELFGKQLLPATFSPYSVESSFTNAHNNNNNNDNNGSSSGVTDLVHFISAREFFHASAMKQGNGEYVNSFLRMESSLRCFLLEKRSQSKLIPIKTYLFNLITDIQQLAAYNNQLAADQLEQTTAELEMITPIYQRLVAFQKNYSDHAEHCRQNLLQSMRAEGRQTLESWVANIGSMSKRVAYPGLFRSLAFARQLLTEYNNSIGDTLFNFEHDSLTKTMSSITQLHEMAGKSVPDWHQLLPSDTLLRLSSTPLAEMTNDNQRSPLSIEDEKISNEEQTPSEMQLIRVGLDMSDFIEPPSTELMLSAATVGAMVTVTAGMVGYQRVVGVFFQTCQAVGLNSMSKILAATAAIAGTFH